MTKKEDSIHLAIGRIMKDTGYVRKDSKIVMRSGASYSVTTEAAVIKAVRPNLVEESINIYPRLRELAMNGDRATVIMDFTLHHIPTGTEVEISMAGAGQDPGDKMVAKAVTHAEKYAFLKLFVLETGDDPDKERPEEQEPRYPAEPAMTGEDVQRQEFNRRIRAGKDALTDNEFHAAKAEAAGIDGAVSPAKSPLLTLKKLADAVEHAVTVKSKVELLNMETDQGELI